MSACLTIDDVGAASFSLNDRQYQFCLEYIVDLNATQAYIRAGYSKSGARQSACKLLTNADIRKCIWVLRQMQHTRLKRMKNAHELAQDADAVLNRMAQLAMCNIGHFVRINDQGLPYYDFSGVTEEDLLGLVDLKIKQQVVPCSKCVHGNDVIVHEISIHTDITKNLHALARRHDLLKYDVTAKAQPEMCSLETAKRIAFIMHKARRD